MDKTKEGDSTRIVGPGGHSAEKSTDLSLAAVLRANLKKQARRNVTTLPLCNRQGSHVLLVFPQP